MPIRHTDKGWFWGSKGPFPSKDKALQVARAAHASGFKENGKITIVVGPPCAGKSSYAKEKASLNDVIVDYDELSKALGNSISHQATGDIRQLTFLAREAIISKILLGIESNCFIIHTNPKESQIQKYKASNAEFVLLDPGQTVCLHRAKKRPSGTDEIINKWYETPPNLDI